MHSIRRAVIVLCLATLAPIALAEPGRVTKSLMDEPMSIFDWGIFKLDQKLETFRQFKTVFMGEYLMGSAAYDWDADRIRINLGFIGTGSQAECIENLKRAKLALLNFPAEAELRTAASKAMSSFFSHEGGYQSARQPKDAGEVLANMTVIEATVYVIASNGYAPKSKCQTTLRSKEISVVAQ